MKSYQISRIAQGMRDRARNAKQAKRDAGLIAKLRETEARANHYEKALREIAAGHHGSAIVFAQRALADQRPNEKPLDS